ncbi:MAG: hypothetical protein ACE5PM_03175, partial [Candidatus Hydrothermarchaeales archaeon]
AKADFDDGWILLRPSNTSPLIRTAVEAKTEDRLYELWGIAREEFEGALDEV